MPKAFRALENPRPLGLTVAVRIHCVPELLLSGAWQPASEMSRTFTMPGSLLAGGAAEPHKEKRPSWASKVE